MKWRRICAFFLALLFGMVSSAHAADCQKTSESCVEGAETRNIGGYPVHRDCWRYRSQFSCVSQAMSDDCQPLRDRGCSQIGSICIDTSPLGACMLYEQTWQCRVASGTSSTITNCGGQQFCLNGHCFDTGNAPDADFAKMVTALEVQREAGKYVDPIIQDVLDLSYLTGQRPADVLKMRWSQVQDGAIWIVQGKTKAKLRIDVVGELATLFERIKARGLVGMTILADPKGQALKAFGYFRSHFDKARDAAKVEADALGVPFIRFQLRDLRAKAASDLESMSHARKLLGHTTENMTREYIRARVGERVSPVMAKSFSPLPDK